MKTFAHIVNPFQANRASDLSWAQPITFASMKRAKDKAKGKVRVDLLSAQYEEDRPFVPADFKQTTDLQRSVLDEGSFSQSIRLPILNDILERLYRNTDAEYLIFTNVDIALQPHFYLRLGEIVEQGYDAFIINRRRIPVISTQVEDLDKLYAAKGKRHPGFDCFVFQRSLFPNFVLANVCIGVPFIGITLAQNLFCYAQKFKLFDDEHLTFHMGMEVFKKRAPKEYFEYNKKEFWKAMDQIYEDLDSRKWPWGDQSFPYRMIRWGLHPSLPIRLALRLEKKRLRDF